MRLRTCCLVFFLSPIAWLGKVVSKPPTLVLTTNESNDLPMDIHEWDFSPISNSESQQEAFKSDTPTSSRFTWQGQATDTSLQTPRVKSKVLESHKVSLPVLFKSRESVNEKSDALMCHYQSVQGTSVILPTTSPSVPFIPIAVRTKVDMNSIRRTTVQIVIVELLNLPECKPQLLFYQKDEEQSNPLLIQSIDAIREGYSVCFHLDALGWKNPTATKPSQVVLGPTNVQATCRYLIKHMQVIEEHAMGTPCSSSTNLITVPSRFAMSYQTVIGHYNLHEMLSYLGFHEMQLSRNKRAIGLDVCNYRTRFRATLPVTSATKPIVPFWSVPPPQMLKLHRSSMAFRISWHYGNENQWVGCKPKVVYYDASSRLLYVVPHTQEMVAESPKISFSFTSVTDLQEVFPYRVTTLFSHPDASYFGLIPENLAETCRYFMFDFERVDVLKHGNERCATRVAFYETYTASHETT